MDYLRRAETRMNSFGSALPGHRDRPKHHLVIVDEREYEFGWAFFWNTKEFVESGDHRHPLAGNAPMIVDRSDGRLYVTGTAHSWEHYLGEYRGGKRRLAEQDAAPNSRPSSQSSASPEIRVSDSQRTPSSRGCW
jgi:hypothetical protein